MNAIAREELSVVERFRESHHAVAMMFAAGMHHSMIRQRTGYSTRRLTLLWNDPSFQELIAVYGRRVREKYDENIDHYLDLGMSNMIRAEAQIAEALDKSEEPGADPISLVVLDRIAQGRADRFGYSKHATVRVEHDFARRMDDAITRSSQAKLIEHSETEPAPASAPQASPVLVQEAQSTPRSTTAVRVEPQQSPASRGSSAAGVSFAAVLRGRLRTA